MLKHEIQNNWSEIKGKAKRQWDAAKHQSKHHDRKEDFDDDDSFRSKKERDDKQMQELKSILRLMSADGSREV